MRAPLRQVPKDAVIKFGSLQLYMKFVNGSIGQIFFVREMLLYLEVLYIFVMVITAVAGRGFVMAVHRILQALPLVLIINYLLNEMVRMYVASKKVLVNWKRRQYSRKVIRSCYEVQFSAGGLYRIKWLSIATFTGSIVCNTINILIALRQNGLFLR